MVRGITIEGFKGVIIFIFIMSGTLCFSQQKYSIKGKVRTKDESVIKKYNMLILQNENPSDNNSEYEFSDKNFSLNLSHLPINILISAPGYKDTVVYINSPESDLDIILRKSEINLSEVIVKGILPEFHNRKDRMEVQVSNTALSETGSAIDILQKAPKIKVDDKYGIYLGIDEATIYIDGRQIPNNKALEMLSSRDIERIELITTPSVKYDSNANVIIDIITKSGSSVKKKGVDGDITTRMTKGKYWRQFVQGDIRASLSKLSLYGSMTFAPEKKLHKETYSRNIPYGKYNVFLVNDLRTVYDTDRNNSAMLGALYNISDKHSIGIEGNAQFQKGENCVNLDNIIYQKQGDEKPLATVKQNYGSQYDRNNYTGVLTHTFTQKSGYYQKTIFDIYEYNDDSKQDLSEEDKPGTGPSNRNEVKNNLFSLRTDLSFPAADKLQINAGAKYQYRRNRSEHESIQNGKAYTNLYKYDDKSAALYGMGIFSTGNLKIEAGARVEYINNTAQSSLFSQDTSKWSIVPNINMNYRFNDKISLDLIYTQNIQRPSFEQLNPAKNFVADTLFYRTGNPALKDERRHNLSLKANYNDKSIAFNYIRRNDAITWVMDRDPQDASKTRSTQMNLQKAEMFSIDAVVPYRSDPFNVFVATGIIHSKIESEKSEISMKQTLWYATANMDFNLPYVIKLNTNHRYFTKGLMQVFYFQPSYRADVSMKRNFLKDKLSAVLIWNDIFKTDKMKTYTNMNDNPVTYNYSYDQSTVSLSLSYNFSL